MSQKVKVVIFIKEKHTKSAPFHEKRLPAPSKGGLDCPCPSSALPSYFKNLIWKVKYLQDLQLAQELRKPKSYYHCASNSIFYKRWNSIKIFLTVYSLRLLFSLTVYLQALAVVRKLSLGVKITQADNISCLDKKAINFLSEMKWQIQ